MGRGRGISGSYQFCETCRLWGLPGSLGRTSNQGTLGSLERAPLKGILELKGDFGTYRGILERKGRFWNLPEVPQQLDAGLFFATL